MSTNKSAAPKPLSDNGNLAQNWIKWKEEFITFMVTNNFKNISNDLQAYMFRNYIGKVGQDIMEKIITNDSERDDINILLGKFDKYFDLSKVKTHVNPPGALSESGDMASNWIKWKQDFLMFVESKRIKSKPKDLQAIMLTTYIGKVGQNIINRIVTDPKEKNDLDILLQRLDEYFDSPIYGNSNLLSPDPLSNIGDMAQNWTKWKQDFRMYLKAIDATNKPNDFQAYILKKSIGEFGKNIIEKIVTNSKEKDDINILLERLDKYFDSSKNADSKYLPLPSALSNKGDVLQNWIKWKKDFLLCMKTRDSSNKSYQAYLLKSCIGKYGQDIIERTVTDPKEKEDINILLQKLDNYFESSNNDNADLPPPGPLPNDGDMAKNWIKWKKDFMMYLKATGASSKSMTLQAIILTTCIGKFGKDIIEKIVTDSKEREDINILLQRLDKYFDSSKNNGNIHLPHPGPLSDNGSKNKNWIKWKKDFMLYLKATDATSKPSDVQAYLLRTYIGKFGQDIIEKIVTDSKEKDNINILLQRLDKYFEPPKPEVQQRYYFFTSVRKPNVSIEDYIIDLKAKAATCNFGKLMDSLIRDKIIVETTDKHLRNKLLNEENLNLLKLRSIYNEHLSQNLNNTVPNEPKNPNQYKKWNCKKCDTRHAKQACPAWRVKCEKCGIYNHFTSCCPHNFTNKDSEPNVSTETAHSPNTLTQWKTIQTTIPSHDCENTLYPRLDQLKTIEKNTRGIELSRTEQNVFLKSDEYLQKQGTSMSLDAQSSTNTNVSQATATSNISKDKDETQSDTACRIS